MTITLRDRWGRWIECPCWADTSPECADALALADAETAALDEQPYPRGDWSGNPETFHRPHSHLGGDLPLWHPWNALSFTERARRWRSGERPDMGAAAFRRASAASARGAESLRFYQKLRARGITPTFPAEDPAFRHEMAAHAVAGVTFYDPNLAHLGNAVSPFQVAPTFQEANLALQRRPEDRYSARYDSQGYFFQQPEHLAAAPLVPDALSQAREALAAFFADRPEVTGVLLSCAGGRLADGRFVDTRPPGHGLVAEGETQSPLNAVEVGTEMRRDADRLRALAGDEIMGVPIVYSAREEWSQRMPHIARPSRGDEWYGIG